jgi:hypothetical protein
MKPTKSSYLHDQVEFETSLYETCSPSGNVIVLYSVLISAETLVILTDVFMVFLSLSKQILG